MTWKSDVRRWARGQGATHAAIGCGDEKRLTISACLGRVDAVHTSIGTLVARIDGRDNLAVISAPGGKARAILHTPQRRTPDGVDDHGRPRWNYQPTTIKDSAS